MSTIRKSIHLNASREHVWKHLTDPQLLAGWLMRNNFVAQTGHRFRFEAQAHGDWDGVVESEVVECIEPERLCFTWNANNLGARSLVTIELKETENGTQLSLLHKELPTDPASIIAKHDAGWDDHLHILQLQIDEDHDGRADPPPVDWSRFTLHVHLDCEVERALRFWRTSEGMEAFFVEMMRIVGPEGEQRAADTEALPGDLFIWRWHNGRTVAGTYREPSEHGDVCFTFGDSTVAVAAQPDRGGTLLRLTQFDIPDDDQARMHIHANCRGGWVYFLTNLKALIEHGIDIRDNSRETGASFSTYFEPQAIGVEFAEAA